MTIIDQYKTRKKYQKIRCPKCENTSRIVKHRTLQRIPGFQMRECTSCGHIFYYDYVMEADYQFKYWKGVIPK